MSVKEDKAQLHSRLKNGIVKLPTHQQNITTCLNPQEQRGRKDVKGLTSID